MLNYLAQNWGTIVVCFFLACIIAAIIVKMIIDRRHGRSSCCGDCKHCGGTCNSAKHSSKTVKKCP